MTTASTTIAARLDRLPKSRYIRRLIVLISLGGCFELYDLFFTAYIALGLFKSAIFTPTTKALFGLEGFASFVAALFAGLFVGTIVFSRLSDRFGRRSIFTFSLLWYSVCTLIMAFQSTAMAIDIWRFIASVGIGVELVNIDTYVSELVPRESRGRAFAFNQTIAFIAVPVVALISTLLVPITVLGHDGWRWVVGIGSIGAVFIWFIRLGLPESPRWLAQRGRLAEADKVMTEMENKVRAETGRELPPPRVVAGETEEKHGAWIEMWQGVYFGRTIMMSAYNFLQTIGYYGFATWVPTLLIQQGITVTKSLEYTFIIAIANPFGPLLGQLFADRIERKWQVAGAAIAIAVLGLIFSQQTTAAGIILLGILITLANNVLSYSFHAYQAELYPTRIRAQAVGFVYSWSRFSAIFTGFIIAWVLGHYHVTGVFVFIAAAMILVFLIIAIFGPRTNQLRLEEIAR
ncbi:MAG TPA: MFS transporter [Reyranella sp.]|nr:MFS transporter [Reyranella sp.]